MGTRRSQTSSERKRAAGMSTMTEDLVLLNSSKDLNCMFMRIPLAYGQLRVAL